MAENTYEYECMRAELLGIDKPTYDDWLKKHEELKKINGVVESGDEDQDQDIENLKAADSTDESLGRISGGLDELNSILQITQRKIHRFKTSCGSLTNLLKFKIGGNSMESTTIVPTTDENSDDKTVTPTNLQPTVQPQQQQQQQQQQRKSDLAKALDNHVDSIDALIEKAENAQYSMAYQNKEMKRFLQ